MPERRRVLVTGGASGIGLAVARRLADDGDRVVVADVDGAALHRLEQTLPGCVTVVADLARAEDVHRLAAEVGAVDVLVNNAGLQRVHPIERFPEEEWNTMLAVMLTAPFLLTKAVLPGMYDRGWGRVVNIASVHGLVASPYKACYVAAKHAIVGLTKVVALEAGARCADVTAHAICPSYVRTPLVEAQIADQARAHGLAEDDVLTDVLLASNSVKRLIEPEEVAEAVAFVCRPGAWSMSGSVLTLDAGWLAH
ncbi:3-hydroxybutyrate dehydrogenase [Nocardioides terrisoli]|uniref:3-hydroxybutyrate dehydrogenase n=1 Tax=Nocardioides terrisoli TaxID=3388267 RepID=UPI00287BBF1E|nr:3-hydroxybutyrate dehydrogenase [Nocardioides marmorisolisilvae]